MFEIDRFHTKFQQLIMNIVMYIQNKKVKENMNY